MLVSLVCPHARLLVGVSPDARHVSIMHFKISSAVPLETLSAGEENSIQFISNAGVRAGAVSGGSSNVLLREIAIVNSGCGGARLKG